MFLQVIQAQITSTRVLFAVTFVVLAAAAFVWLAATTGSPVVGVWMLVMALVLTVTVYWFFQVMGMFTGKR
jgi:hypothetical protein